jgi:hypothetical protein
VSSAEKHKLFGFELELVGAGEGADSSVNVSELRLYTPKTPLLPL